MKFVFRVDASVIIGTGHIMRCLALADALKERGGDCRFICRAHPGHLGDSIAKRGYAVELLPNPLQIVESPNQYGVYKHAEWMGADWQSDVQQTAAALADVPDWLIVDHYSIDRRWENAMRNHCRKIMVIDDLADRLHDCDVLLDQNFLPSVDRYAALVPVGAITLIGPRYALLRGEFSSARKRSGCAIAPRLLIMFGGADRSRQTERILWLLVEMGWQDPIDVVAGPLYSDVPALREALSALPAAVLHVSPGNIAALMRHADFAVGAPGVAGLERCSCGLPSITVAQAWNQESIGAALAEAGAHWYLGREAEATDADWKGALQMLGKHAAIRSHMSAAAAAICDGQGVKRVVAHLMHAEMSARIVTESDGDLLFAWRNHERTRRLSHDPRPFNYEAHLRWLAKTLSDPNVDLLLLDVSGLDMACVRFDCQGETATLSIYVDPDQQGRGVGNHALTTAIDWLKMRRPTLKQLNASVMEPNRASHQLFLSSGFKLEQRSYVLDLQRE